MKHTLWAGIGLFAFALATQPAGAADMPSRAPVLKAPAAAAAPFNWTGYYAGVQAGYGWGKADNSSFPEHTNTNGWLAGGQIGFNVQSGRWVWGGELDGAWADIENNGSSSCGPCTYVKINDLVTARLRAGSAVGNTLYYVTGGWASGKVTVNDYDAGDGFLSKRHNGYVVGLGAEQSLAPNSSFKLEYLYVDLGRKTYDLGSPDPVDVRTHLVRLGWNYRFASGKSPVVTKY
jgi:outer membrane immunogenic protein